MFGKKSEYSYSSERPFSIMLAEELFRYDIKKSYGDGIKVFRCDIQGTPVRETKPDSANITDEEKRSSSGKERLVKIAAIIGPFEKTYEPSFEGDKRRNLRRVEAEIRLYSVENGCIWWKPHYLKMDCGDRWSRKEFSIRCLYTDGTVDGVHEPLNYPNPCAEMCDSQTTANYPEFHNLTQLVRQ